jgi:hypothetical protein
MPKRSRYQNVSIVGENVYIYAGNKLHTFNSISRYEPFEYTSSSNLNETRYVLNVVGSDCDQTILCLSENERDNIVSELESQGIF